MRKVFVLFSLVIGISVMAQITVRGVVSMRNGKPLEGIFVSNGREEVRTNAKGFYEIQAYQWDNLLYYGESPVKGLSLDSNCAPIVENTPKQRIDVVMVDYPHDMLFEKNEMCGILFILNGKLVTDKAVDKLKQRLRNDKTLKYKLLRRSELYKKYGYSATYGLEISTHSQKQKK